MLRLRRGAQDLTLLFSLSADPSCCAQGLKVSRRSAASILAQVREAPVALPGTRSPNSAWRARCWSMAKAGTIAIIDDLRTGIADGDLRTGSNADRVELKGIGRVEDHADLPAQSWEQDNAGGVLLTPRRQRAWGYRPSLCASKRLVDANFVTRTMCCLPPNRSRFQPRAA